MALVVDDHLLLDLLTDTPSEWLRSESTRSAVYTTGSWYYRVAHAATRGTGTGTLSSRVAALGSDQQLQVLTWLGHLPDWIGLLGPRLLVPVMANLATRRQPNLLAAEALALALVVDGAIAVAVDSPLLRSGADDLGIAYHLVADR